MVPMPTLRLLFAAAAALASFSAPAAGSAIGFEFHHRFSDRVRQWAEAAGVPGGRGPEKGTTEYYSALAHHDRGRSLAAAPSSQLAFVDGNATIGITPLGFLHYAIVALGTPNMTFLVALDTGSDLFWVPCDCNMNLDDNLLPLLLCESQYAYRILSFTSIVPVHHQRAKRCLTTEDTTPSIVKAPIVFACGEIQTGIFLEGAAPNGLFGLGIGKTSVPSILASQGLIANSFSMCFEKSGFGRINFGDEGSFDQQETPLWVDKRCPSYIINITGIVVGNSSRPASFSALVDTGTSFTCLADPMYTEIAESFNAQVQDQRHSSDPNIPFEYCFF